MNIDQINKDSIKKVSDKELLNIHYRIHQLYSGAKKRNNKPQMKLFEAKHSIVVNEMITRKMKHKSPINTSLKKVRQMYNIKEQAIVIESISCWVQEGWAVGMKGNCKSTSASIETFEKMFPKAKVVENEYDVVISVGHDYIVSFPLDWEMEHDIDLAGGEPLVKTIYLMLSIKCKAKMIDKVTEKDYDYYGSRKELIKNIVKDFKRAGHNTNLRLLNKSIDIFFGGR